MLCTLIISKFFEYLSKLSCAWLANLATLTVDNWLTGELSTFQCCLEHISIRVCSTTFEAAFTDEFWKRSQHQSTCDWIAHKDVNTRCKLVHTLCLHWTRYSQKLWTYIVLSRLFCWAMIKTNTGFVFLRYTVSSYFIHTCRVKLYDTATV